MTAKDDIVRLDVPMDDVLVVVQVGQRLEQTPHDLCADFLGQAGLTRP